jgi:hypothetical protein
MVSREKLQHLYFEEEMTQGEIADELGRSQSYILWKISEHGICLNCGLLNDREVNALG